jgi:hypothetical protein
VYERVYKTNLAKKDSNPMKKLLYMFILCTGSPLFAQSPQVFLISEIDCPDTRRVSSQTVSFPSTAPLEVHLLPGAATELITLSEGETAGEILAEEFELSQGGIGPMSRNGAAVFMAVPLTLNGEMRNFFVQLDEDGSSLTLHRLDRQGHLCGRRGPVAIRYRAANRI